ncbi:putative quinol monooxygenase [Mycoplasmopsis felifaucium]|uniref:Antibiotic biosynthesis monooxygenase n=1 Tax=Mycoplasmopsis felifaucium TaxID=35768 RepID=A0ABZ2RTC8_9BACT
MIYIVYKEIIMKSEMKDRFNAILKSWLDVVKKQELNLSFDVCWKNENTLIFVERWSTQESYNNFLKSAEGKQILHDLENYVDYVVRVERLSTTC